MVKPTEVAAISPKTLPSSAHMVQAFFDRHPHAGLVFDGSGRLLHANAAAAWLASDGQFPDFSQLTGVALRDSEDADSPASPAWNRRLRVHAADGSSRQVDASLYAANDEPGELAGKKMPWTRTKDSGAEIVTPRKSMSSTVKVLTPDTAAETRS